MHILKVFPRKTNATPQDDYTAIGSPGLFIPYDISEIHISVTFTWDLQFTEVLAHQWSRYGHVKIGDPATGMRGEIFTPGLYLKHGYTITYRGCHNHCWFCSVPKREGPLRELPIIDGHKILTIICSLVLKITLELSLICFNVKSKDLNFRAALRLNF